MKLEKSEYMGARWWVTPGIWVTPADPDHGHELRFHFPQVHLKMYIGTCHFSAFSLIVLVQILNTIHIY